MNAMTSSIKTGISKRLVTGLMLATIGFGLVGAGGVQAQDNEHEPGSMPCTAPGSDGPPTIPEDTVIKVGGSYYKCFRGQWWKVPAPSAMSADPTPDGPRHPVKTRFHAGQSSAGLLIAH